MGSDYGSGWDPWLDAKTWERVVAKDRILIRGTGGDL